MVMIVVDIILYILIINMVVIIYLKYIYILTLDIPAEIYIYLKYISLLIADDGFGRNVYKNVCFSEFIYIILYILIIDMVVIIYFPLLNKLIITKNKRYNG